MRRIATVVPALGAALVIAGCGSSSSGGAGVVPTQPATGLRGVALSSPSCHQQATPATSTTPVAAADVASLILCPLSTPNAKPKRVVVHRGDAHFDPIVRALADPDQPAPPTPQACPEFANVPQLVIATTPGGAYALAIPVDSCHHYQPTALSALNAARGVATAVSTPGGAS